MEYLVWTITHLGVWALILLASNTLGLAFLRKQHFHSSLEKHLFQISLGIGLWGLLLFILGLIGVLYTGVILTLTAVASMAGIFELIRSNKEALRSNLLFWKLSFTISTLLTGLAVLLAISYFTLLLLSTQYPSVHWDAISNHLVLAREYLSSHRVTVHDGLTIPILPGLNHLLFTWALTLHDDIVAQMIEHTFLLVTAVGLYCWGRREGRGLMGLAAAAIWTAHPMVRWLGESAYVDLGISAYAFLGAYALWVFWRQREISWWHLAMALFGLAAGVKMNGLLFLIMGGAVAILAYVRLRIGWRPLMLGLILGTAVALPFYAFLGFETGSPFWPKMLELSHGQWQSPAVQALNQGLAKVGIPKTLTNFALLSIKVIWQPEPFLAERTLFPIIAAWPIAWLAAIPSRAARWWILWATAYIAFWFMTSQQLRHITPALPMIGLSLCEALRWILERTRRIAARQAVAWLALIAIALSWSVPDAISQLRQKGWPPLNADQRETFLQNWLTAYDGVRYINSHSSPGDVVYVMNFSWLVYYLQPRAIDFQALLKRFAWAEFWDIDDARKTFRLKPDDRFVHWLESEKVNWLMVNLEYPARTMEIPRENVFWNEYELVYIRPNIWVFRRQGESRRASTR